MLIYLSTYIPGWYWEDKQNTYTTPPPSRSAVALKGEFTV